MIDSLLERNILPDAVIRFGIRRLLRQRLSDERAPNATAQLERLQSLVARLRTSPIAEQTKAANEQHYEVPTEFFKFVLGPNMKYSSAYYRDGVEDLATAEKDMLTLTCERAGVQNGQRILELGCGWGSLTLFMAARYPKARITAVSNSRTQKEFIDAEAKRRGLRNVRVVTADMNTFTTADRFDRVVSVEMFEHMRNYEQLLRKVARWLKPDGRLFVHIFTHKELAYLFEVQGPTDWMAKYFFSGGVMPSDDLLLYFADDLAIEQHWRVSGTHYQKTSRAWLDNMDRNRDQIMPILARTYGQDQVTKWWVYWRVFFMACEELWGFRNGDEWMVSHYVFRKKQTARIKK
jgi:cyclopropane-fatty-acyl-phospholipid synthase